jgi:mono/diheme cytochrome c family protein
VLDPMDDPEWHIHYAISTGVRYTGMPAWGKALSDQDIWKVTAFLSRVDKLPPAVQEYCKKTYGVAPQSHQGEHEHMGHGD